MMKELLFDVLTTLERHHVPCCIVEGTLLGIVRENGFIPWDKDIDIGVRHEDLIPKIPELVSDFANKYFVEVLAFPYNYPREIKLHADGIVVDIINYDMAQYKGEWVRFNVIHDQYASSWHAFDLFQSYTPHEFNGRLIYLPRDPKRYLIETYGLEWRTPLRPKNYIAYPIIPGWFEDQKLNGMDLPAIKKWLLTHEHNGSPKKEVT